MPTYYPSGSTTSSELSSKSSTTVVFALAIFSISISVWIKTSIARTRRVDHTIDEEDTYLVDSGIMDIETFEKEEQTNNIGPRGLVTMRKTAPSYWSGFLTCLQVSVGL